MLSNTDKAKEVRAEVIRRFDGYEELIRRPVVPALPDFRNPAIRVPALCIQDGAAFASSQDIADVFGKAHKNVIRDIENIGSDLSLCPDWFRTGDYRDA